MVDETLCFYESVNSCVCQINKFKLWSTRSSNTPLFPSNLIVVSLKKARSVHG